VAEPPPSPADELRRALVELVALLESRRIPYMIVGAMAVAVWGRPRATADIDVTLRIDRGDLESLAEHAESSGFLLDRQWFEWNPLLRGHQIRLTRGGLTMDAMRTRDAHEEGHRGRRTTAFSGELTYLIGAAGPGPA